MAEPVDFKKQYQEFLEYVKKKESKESDEEKILSLFDITRKRLDFMSNAEIQEILTEAKVEETPKHAKQFLVGKGAKAIAKTIQGHTYRGLTGIAKKQTAKEEANTFLTEFLQLYEKYHK